MSSLPRTVSHPRVQQPSYSTITHASHNDNITKRKQKDPDKFDGKSIEWRDYIVHFEKVAMWNNWSDTDKAQQLAMRFRGKAQKLLGELKPSKMNDYEQLRKYLLDGMTHKNEVLLIGVNLGHGDVRKMKHLQMLHML